jgi:hypothetical protein
MTAKEKATELINKFKDFADEDYMDTKQQFELNETRNLNAKKCALIAIEEIINVCESYVSPYYYEVRKEIENQ